MAISIAWRARILKARQRALGALHAIRAWFSAAIIVLGLIGAGFFAEPVIRRGVDLAKYMLADPQTPLPADQHLVDSLERLYGRPLASSMSTLVILGAMPLNAGDESATAEELDSLATGTPGGTLYWIPSAQSVQDSYGLMLATLFEEEKGDYYKQSKIREVLDSFLSSAKQKAPRNRTLVDSVSAMVFAPPQSSSKVVKKQFRDSAVNLKNALRDAPKTDLVASDLRLYLALAELDDQATVGVPGLMRWLKESPGPMEVIATGELEITVFAATSPSTGESLSQIADANPVVDATAVAPLSPAPTSKRSVTVNARLYGRQSKFFEFARPKWFKDIHIRKAREMAGTSQALAAFFGITGSLRAIPFGVWVEKEPLYDIEVESSDQEKVAAALSLPNSSVAVQFPGGRILAPGTLARRIDSTNWWQLVPPDQRPRVVALVSQEY